MIAKKTSALLLAVLITLLLPATSMAAVRGRVTVRVGSGFRTPTHFCYQPRGIQTGRVTRVNYGTVDFNIRPQNSKVFVDGQYLGIADQFNGYPQTATLPAGYHNIRIESPSGEVFQQRIFVAAGKEFNLNFKF